MVTLYVERMTAPCSPILVLFLVSLLLHKLIKSGTIDPCVSAGKYGTPAPTTLKHIISPSVGE